jgi:RNA polymerase sigma-70 factor (ECF subfamily)
MELAVGCGHKGDVNAMDDPSDLTDAVLWRRAVDGDAESYGVLFDRHCEAIRSYCARRLGSLEGVDDLVSIVFLEAWRRRDDAEVVDERVLPWLYGIARRTIQNRWRTTLRHRRALAKLPPTVAAHDHADEVAARLDDQRDLEQVRVAFAKLGTHDQEVLTLCVWQGLDYAAASVALGVPIGTVRSRLSRARDRLRAATAARPRTPDHRAIAVNIEEQS